MQYPVSLSLYDSYLKKIITLLPETTAIPGTLKMYSCGPTVYNYQSIGNMRAIWLADTVAKVAKLGGWKVEWTLNITDVGHLVSDSDTGGDKIEEAAKKNQTTVDAVVSKYTKDYENQCGSLRFALPKGFYYPKATEYIEEQILLTWQLINTGLAYVSVDGIYFDYLAFRQIHGHSATGALKEILERDAKSHGDRTRTDRTIESSAKHPFDFAVWKFVTPESLQSWRFDSYPVVLELASQSRLKISEYEKILTLPGCPGWHSECVCMIVGTLANKSAHTRDTLYPEYYIDFADKGPLIDLHFGGEDHIDIHHKNEILQSKGLGFELSKYWIHNKFVMVDAQKMSKSLGNIYQVVGDKAVTGFESLLQKGYDPLAYRLMLMEHQYTEQLNFVWEKLDQSRARLTGLRKLASSIEAFARANSATTEAFQPAFDPLMKYLTDNLKTHLFLESYTELLLSLVDTITQHNTLDVTGYTRAKGWDALFLQLDLFIDHSPELLQLVEDRTVAKRTKDFETADKLRNDITAQGYAVDDYMYGVGIRLLAEKPITP